MDGLCLMNYLMLLTLAIQNLFRLSVLPMSFITDLHHLLRVAKFALIVLAVCKTRFISVCKYRYHWLHLSRIHTFVELILTGHVYVICIMINLQHTAMSNAL